MKHGQKSLPETPCGNSAWRSFQSKSRAAASINSSAIGVPTEDDSMRDAGLSCAWMQQDSRAATMEQGTVIGQRRAALLTTGASYLIGR